MKNINISIKGFLPSTLIDWPGKVAAILFTYGCNFRCPFCHNPELVLENSDEDLDLEEILKFLRERKKWIDGVVITGGEPTLWPDLPLLIQILKKEGFLVKLDTNGTNPSLLSSLLDEKLIDYVAMDIKGPLERYPEITRRDVKEEDILSSINLIMKSGIDYEFRTTILPYFHKKEDIEKIGKLIKGAKKFYLQQFYPTKTLDPNFMNEESYLKEDLLEFQKIIAPFVQQVEIRGI